MTSHGDVPRCHKTCNPGVWPYISRCTRDHDHDGKHVDRHGNEWEDEG